MKRAFLLALLAGCGGSDPTIDGTWVAQASDICLFGAQFDRGAGTYVADVACSLQGGGLGVERETGVADFSQSGIVVLTPKMASCPSSEHTMETDTYSFADEGQLVITTPNGAIIFRRPPQADPTTNGTLQFGCHGPDAFMPHALEAL